MRVLACPHCKEEITHAEQEIDQHVDPQNGDCERKLVHCEFREVGCTAMVPKKNMADHRHGSLGNHLLMLMQTFIPFLGMIQTIDSDSKDVRELKSAVERQGNKISEIEDERKNLEQTVKELVTLKNDNHNKVCA
ncbi:TNF receptor-associated factor 2-like [Ptychodera flava]|uniref:TNF receptor-associated factor 2-like n=1 Tax=Ptychodera flava TaxID=63121 RepID=UPI003969F894